MSCLQLRLFFERASAVSIKHVLILSSWLASVSLISEAQAKCQVDSPYWRNMMHSWQGACVNGKAEGKGIVKIYPSSRTTTDLFLGEVKQGLPLFGVYEGADGFIAGTFQQGQIVAEQDRNQLIEAFQLAADIAQSYSRELKQQGNMPSARFYENKARQLQQQMD